MSVNILSTEELITPGLWSPARYLNLSSHKVIKTFQQNINFALFINFKQPRSSYQT